MFRTKNLLFFLLLLCCMTGSAKTKAPASELPLQWNDLPKGAQWAVYQGTLFGEERSFAVFRCPLRNHKAEVASDPGRLEPRSADDPAAPDPLRPATTTSGFGERYDALAAINAGYFDMRTLFPTTFVLDEGEQEGETTPPELGRVNGLITMKGHKVKMGACMPDGYRTFTGKYREAIASGPVLMADGKVVGNWDNGGFFDDSHPRSVIGTGGGYLFLLVIDGRFDNAKGTSIPNTAELCRMLGMEEAVNLDGGGSSALWVSGVGVISHPCDNRTFDHYGERTIPNAIIVH